MKKKKSLVEREEDVIKKRFSKRFQKSITFANSSVDIEIDNNTKELEEVGAKPATVMEILRFAKPELKLIIPGVLLSFIMGFAWPLYSIIYGRMFLSLTDLENLPKLKETQFINLIAYIILGLITGFANFSAGSLLGIVGEKLTMRLRLLVYKNILRQDGYFFDNPLNSTGKLTERLAVDAPNVQAAIDQRLAAVFEGVVSLFGGIIVAFFYGWNVALFSITVAFALVLLQTSVTNHLKRRSMKDIKLAENVSKIATESIQHVRTIQALTRQDQLYALFCDALHKPHKCAIIRGLWQSLTYGITICFVPCNFAFSYMFGLFLIKGKYTSPFIVFQVTEALNMAAFTIMRTASYLPEYLRAKISAGIMFSMIKQKPIIDSFSELGLKPEIKGSIKIKKLNFSYPNSQKNLILNNFSINALNGKKVALVGPSGCGKSTIIQLLIRFYDVKSKSLFIDNLDIQDINIQHFRKTISLVGQEPILFNLSIKDNIAYGLTDVTDEKITEAAKIANIHAFIDSLPQKYETNVGSRGSQLSGGQKQRIAIARAIIRDPKILLLDEATSALDTESEKIVQSALDVASKNRTCIIIAHRLSTIQHADLIILVRDGQVFEIGTHQKLLSQKGLYYRLVQKQAN